LKAALSPDQSTCADIIGSGAYWAGRAVTCPLFVPNGQALLFALPLFCLQIDFSSILY